MRNGNESRVALQLFSSKKKERTVGIPVLHCNCKRCSAPSADVHGRLDIRYEFLKNV